jgi:hypothetical protein
MREFHLGAQRYVFEMRHVWLYHGMFVKRRRARPRIGVCPTIAVVDATPPPIGGVFSGFRRSAEEIAPTTGDRAAVQSWRWPRLRRLAIPSGAPISKSRYSYFFAINSVAQSLGPRDEAVAKMPKQRQGAAVGLKRSRNTNKNILYILYKTTFSLRLAS